MQQSFKLAAAAALCATAFAAHADMTMDANLELDTTYQNKVEDASNARDSDLNMGGRVEFNVGAKATNGDAFVAARASLLLKKDGDTATDDMWVQFGNAAGDVKLGRFEAMDLFPLGKDTVVDEVNGTYKANAEIDKVPGAFLVGDDIRIPIQGCANVGFIVFCRVLILGVEEFFKTGIPHQQGALHALARFGIVTPEVATFFGVNRNGSTTATSHRSEKRWSEYFDHCDVLNIDGLDKVCTYLHLIEIKIGGCTSPAHGC